MSHLSGTAFVVDNSNQTSPLVRVIDDPPIIQTTTVTLTNAQIKALPTSPIVVIPATETLNYSGFPDQIFNVVAASLIMDATAGAYTNVNGACQVLLVIGSDWSLTAGRSLQTKATTPFWVADTSFFNDTKKYLMSLVIGPETITSGSILDNSIAITIDNSSDGNFTGGNGANTMKVIVYYTIENLG